MEYAEMKHSFDTHKHIKALVAQGMQETQAETIVSTIVESKEFDLSKLATKEQLALVQKDNEHIKENMVTKITFTEEISKLRTSFTDSNAALIAEISKLRTDNHRWMISMLLAIIGMIITMIIKS